MKKPSRPSVPFFPMMIDIYDKEILIVGGGKIAARRAETLSRCGAKITAISPNFCDKFPKVFKKFSRPFESEDVQEKFSLIIAATDNRNINRKIHDVAQQKKIPVNVCDCQDECDFFFPSLINVENIAVSVSTAGQNSKLTRKLSDKLRAVWATWIESIHNS